MQTLTADDPDFGSNEQPEGVPLRELVLGPFSVTSSAKSPEKLLNLGVFDNAVLTRPTDGVDFEVDEVSC